MSFQRFEQVLALPPHKPKGLPSLELINTLTLICEDTPNSYDARSHVLTINDWGHFQSALTSKISRSVSSFEKQLKVSGFKKYKRTLYDQRQDDYNSQPEKTLIRYKWRGDRQAYINRQTNFSQIQIKMLMEQAAFLKENIIKCQKSLEINTNNMIFRAMRQEIKTEGSPIQSKKVLASIKHVINVTHHETSKIIKGINNTINSQINMVRMLNYCPQHSQQQ